MDESTEREKMLAGRLFLPFDPELESARVEARRLAQAYAACDPGAGAERGAVLSRLFAHVGRGAFVEAPFHCDYGWNVALATRCTSTPAACCSTARRSRSARAACSDPASSCAP